MSYLHPTLQRFFSISCSFSAYSMLLPFGLSNLNMFLLNSTITPNRIEWHLFKPQRQIKMPKVMLENVTFYFFLCALKPDNLASGNQSIFLFKADFSKSSCLYCKAESVCESLPQCLLFFCMASVKLYYGLSFLSKHFPILIYPLVWEYMKHKFNHLPNQIFLLFCIKYFKKYHIPFYYTWN